VILRASLLGESMSSPSNFSLGLIILVRGGEREKSIAQLLVERLSKQGRLVPHDVVIGITKDAPRERTPRYEVSKKKKPKSVLAKEAFFS